MTSTPAVTTTPAAITERDLDVLAWKFLASEFTGQVYANWAIEKRVDAYLAHHGLMDLIKDGAAYDTLVERVMANVGPALRRGILPQPSPREVQRRG